MTENLRNVLGRRVNHDGRVLVSERALLEECRATRDALVSALRTLEETRQIEILSPLPFLVLRLRSWSSSSNVRALKMQPNSSSKREAQGEVPVSSAAAAKQQREVGGAGEGEGLLDEVLAALGPEADRQEFRSILAGRHPSLIHRCLRRVQATKHIRVSKPALFRSLLQKLSH